MSRVGAGTAQPALMGHADGTANGHHGPALEEVAVLGGEEHSSTSTGSTGSTGDAKAQLANEAAAFMDSVATFRQRIEAGGGDALAKRQSQKMLDVMSTATKPMHRTASQARLSRVIRVQLEWANLNYSMVMGRRKKRTTKVILDRVSAVVPPGRLLAIMGPTGCGKTSLVNALAGRLPVGGTLEGEILCNGVPRGRGFRTITAYVMQDDVLFYNLTVRETLEFAAKMRLPSSVPAAAKSELVSEIIAELGLAKAQNTFIGNSFVRGISGGERKRVCIALEILSNPSLIFLDEPTSGLDAFQAQNVMESLWGLARSGRSVLASIHQPRSSIYKMFDLLLLLSEGKTIYFGPAAKAVAWFEALGFPCPAHYNPADFFLDVVSMDHRTPDAEASSRVRIELLAEEFKKVEEASGDDPKSHPCPDPEDIKAIKEVNDSPGYPNSLPAEFWLLLQRAWKQASRDRIPQIVTLAQATIIGFVLAALYSQMEMNQTGIQDEIGILFFVAIYSAMGAMFAAITTFPTDRGVVNRERAGKAYHVAPYYVARFICDMPLRVGQGLLFGVILYWIVGLNPAASAFFIFVGLVILEGLAAQALGTAISAATSNEKAAMAIAPALTTILMLFGGFYVNAETIPAVLRWIRYLSHLYFVFMGLAVNDFGGRTGWECNGAPGTGCITTGDQILATLGFQGKSVWEAVIGLTCLTVFYNFLGYLLLRFKKPKFLPLSPEIKKA